MYHYLSLGFKVHCGLALFQETSHTYIGTRYMSFSETRSLGQVSGSHWHNHVLYVSLGCALTCFIKLHTHRYVHVLMYMLYSKLGIKLSNIWVTVVITLHVLAIIFCCELFTSRQIDKHTCTCQWEVYSVNMAIMYISDSCDFLLRNQWQNSLWT